MESVVGYRKLLILICTVSFEVNFLSSLVNKVGGGGGGGGGRGEYL